MDPLILIAEAQKKAKGGFLASLFGGPRYDEAAELLVQAANQYKVKSQWSLAADTFIEAAKMHGLAEDPAQEANQYVEAGHMKQKISHNLAKDPFEKASEIFVRTGRFNQAAKLVKGLAEEHESAGDFKLAIESYKRAADYFDLDRFGKSMFSQTILKYADLVSRYDGNLEEAIKIYETEGVKAVSSSLLSFGAKDLFFKAGILQLSKLDAITGSVSLERYKTMDPRFESSREYILLKGLTDAYEHEDPEAFVAALTEYDSIHRLDAWKVHFLNKIKSSMRPVLVEAAKDAAPLAVIETDDGTVDLT